MAAVRTWCSDPPLDQATALHALEHGELSILGRLVEASNATLLCDLALPEPLPDGTGSVHAVYKPIRGERPLDDFPDGTLAYREVAAWLVSEALGGSVVPPTVLRDGPMGLGATQLWIDVDESTDVLRLILTRDGRLRRFALLDAITNNADRKGGHILPTATGDIHGCDHGICFAAEPKLRTVLWGWKGDPLTADERVDVGRVWAGLDGELGERLAALLAPREVDATRRRVDALLATGCFPEPDPWRHVIPWPPF
ncbi:MAG: SCO1664 family protein [Chloroflexota bacterium]